MKSLRHFVKTWASAIEDYRMPKVRRWFHCSQGLNHDPEFREFAKKFGLAGVRFWIEALSILDRTDNFWDLQKGFDLGWLAGTCETKKHIIQASYQHLIDVNWLRVGIDVNQKLFIYAPKWSEYNKRREHEGSTKDTSRYQQGTHPTPSPYPYPKESKKKEKKVDSVQTKEALYAFEKFWESYPTRNGKKLGKLDAQEKFLALTKDDQLRAIQAAHNYANSQRVQDGIGIKDPHRFLQKNKNGSEFWREWVTPEISQNGKVEHKLCSSRIELEGNLQTCKRPSTKMVGKSFICDECYELYEKKQRILNQKGELSAN